MRYILLFSFLFVFSTSLNAQIIHAKIDDNNAYFTEGNDTILVYQIAEKSLNGAYTRNNYIHPLYSLDGQILTEDFPKDHPHHRGIFWAWHQLYINDIRLGDGWELENFHQEIKEVTLLKPLGVSKSIKTNTVWKSNLFLDENGNEKPLIKENTTITVHPKKHNYRLINVKITIMALEPNISLGGSTDAKGYGGFSARIKLSKNTIFTGKEGVVVPDNLPVQSEGWIDISDNTNAPKGIAIFSHPENPDYPNPWILRDKKSMQNAVFPHPGAKTIPLSQTKPTKLSYGLLIHNGTAKDVNIERLYEKYKITRP